MDKIVFLSSALKNIQPWYDVLKFKFNTCFVHDYLDFNEDNNKNEAPSLLIVDAQSSNFVDIDLGSLKSKCGKILVIGDSLSEDKQIKIILEGSSGYVDKSLNTDLIPRVVESILKNEIWLERQLIPKMITGLVAKHQVQFDENNLNILKNLTGREREVIKFISNGDSNDMIAEKMNISSRTVKAHLASIFRKLDVEDRFQLIVKLKNAQIQAISSIM